MLVSVIIPCYKQAEYLPDCIESVRKQTYKEIEIIVVDDGSPDTTAEIAAQFPVKLIRQSNKGLANARNAGIMNARGQYILPLDADDKLHPDCITELVRVAKATQADIIAPSMRTFGTSDETVILMAAPTLEDFRTGNRIPYASLIRKSALLEVGGYSSRMERGWEDYHLWFNLLTRGKRIVTIPQPLFMYRTKEESMWTRTKGHEKELWDQIFKDFPEILPKDLFA
jgi:glycosyltransferase involved in cell wall biosynthesis